ncbi:MAG: hypothetical protein HYW77_02905 [Parcubacteria group bacterium]|nr:hypothetical protein [Parcubacteria group bacterium]
MADKKLKVFKATCHCGGEIKNEIIWAITEDKELVVYGLCNKCLKHKVAKITLVELEMVAPTKNDLSGDGHT